MEENIGTQGKASLTEDIAAKIKREILLQQYVPGDVLPREEELAHMYGSSRAVIREALGTLKTQGYLESKRGKYGGTFVKNISESSALENLFGDLILMRQMKINDLLTARLLIEPEAVRLTTQRATQQDLQELEDIVEQAEDITGTLHRARHNALFHIQLAKLCGNPFYELSIRSFLNFTVSFTDMLGDKFVYIHNDKGHRGILDAIQSHDPQLAYERLYVHISELKGAMISQEKLFRELHLA